MHCCRVVTLFMNAGLAITNIDDCFRVLHVGISYAKEKYINLMADNTMHVYTTEM